MTVRDEILEIIRGNCALPEPTLSFDSAFKDISIDSLSFIGLIVELEDKYGIEFEYEELNIYTYSDVGEFADEVESRIKNKNKIHGKEI